MLYASSDTACSPTPTWLLVLPPTPTVYSLPLDAALVLDLFATITTAPAAIPPDLWGAPLETLTPDRATAFLKRICTHLSARIPYLSWEVLDWEEDTDALYSFFRIPVEPIGLDTCNGDVVGSGAVFTWIGALCDFAVEELVYPLPAPQEVPPDLDLFDLVSVLSERHRGHVLAGLADMLAVLDHRTSTFFLDACPACWHPNMDEGTEWDDDNLTWLEQDAANAQAIMDRIDTLEAWVAEDRTRIGAVWQALLEAHGVYRHQAVADRRPKTLVELWGGGSQETTEADPSVAHGQVADMPGQAEGVPL